MALVASYRLCYNGSLIHHHHESNAMTSKPATPKPAGYHGYPNRMAYLRDLADEYDVCITTVCVIADLLGPDEDFDGLVATLQDLPTDLMMEH